MLDVLEEFLADVLQGALQAGVKVRTGPRLAVPAKDQECVDVAAWGVEAPLAAEEDGAEAREPSFFTRVHRWDADGQARDFVLPQGEPGEVLEVESPPGHPRRREDDYRVEGGTVRFYRAPAAGQGAVVATLRTGPAEGFHERRPCHGRLTLAAWAAELPRADELLERALAAVLVACVDLGTLEARHLEASGVRMRLLAPVLALEAVERTRVEASRRLAPKAEARLRLRGQLELTVAVGAEQPRSRIQSLRYTATVLRPR
jgi:hypothetical protein